MFFDPLWRRPTQWRVVPCTTSAFDDNAHFPYVCMMWRHHHHQQWQLKMSFAVCDLAKTLPRSVQYIAIGMIRVGIDEDRKQKSPWEHPERLAEQATIGSWEWDHILCGNVLAPSSGQMLDTNNCMAMKHHLHNKTAHLYSKRGRTPHTLMERA